MSATILLVLKCESTCIQLSLFCETALYYSCARTRRMTTRIAVHSVLDLLTLLHRRPGGDHLRGAGTRRCTEWGPQVCPM